MLQCLLRTQVKASVFVEDTSESFSVCWGHQWMLQCLLRTPVEASVFVGDTSRCFSVC